MNAEPVVTRKDFRDFYHLPNLIYRGNTLYRSTENDIQHLLLEGPSAFRNHATVDAFIIREGGNQVGRFALIQDKKLPGFVQVSFFEAMPHLDGISSMIADQARETYPECKKMIVGLNGHLNYGAGILLNTFDTAPVFGLPYNPEYYQGYFRDCTRRTMVSFRFPTEPFFEYHRRMGDNPDLNGISVRTLNKRRLREETEIYTRLNNACFADHPFWAERDVAEDFELFHPFRYLIREENLLFAERNGEPIGFFLWYPDFNELVRGNRPLGLRHVLRYRFFNPIRSFRFTEIAVLPGYMNSHAVQAMILHAVPYIRKRGILSGEGGFIFEENRKSMIMTRRFLERATGKCLEPHRQYAVFEKGI